MRFLTISNVHVLVSHYQLLFCSLLTGLTKNTCFAAIIGSTYSVNSYMRFFSQMNPVRTHTPSVDNIKSDRGCSTSNVSAITTKTRSHYKVKCNFFNILTCYLFKMGRVA